ncbi:MAG: hypothetical protein A2015_02165 [Spirochaetes bacterium GWF1_31_7]|nr:MAG: hypothetical protein A2Y30_06015 [Spirochaetes bacterium GWE1_32_154]OHD50720.1 MAG: hypothetical protein A2015_02165 [Spirochaetes bacterium GWF1_31_7]OHD73151.1 MAG: hypothetical protein A2355_05020 [Spirochaetes bacterium RIFOXYB1_FULL_32_8]HBD95056.1 hypothetical protein [Spirochaetia bacterium]HBI38058.1 hypothetical protein [Spirochaetia bacterium]
MNYKKDIFTTEFKSLIFKANEKEELLLKKMYKLGDDGYFLNYYPVNEEIEIIDSFFNRIDSMKIVGSYEEPLLNTVNRYPFLTFHITLGYIFAILFVIGSVVFASIFTEDLYGSEKILYFSAILIPGIFIASLIAALSQFFNAIIDIANNSFKDK